jgi:hypothetical protein
MMKAGCSGRRWACLPVYIIPPDEIRYAVETIFCVCAGFWSVEGPKGTASAVPPDNWPVVRFQRAVILRRRRSVHSIGHLQQSSGVKTRRGTAKWGPHRCRGTQSGDSAIARSETNANATADGSVPPSPALRSNGSRQISLDPGSMLIRLSAHSFWSVRRSRPPGNRLRY